MSSLEVAGSCCPPVLTRKRLRPGAWGRCHPGSSSDSRQHIHESVYWRLIIGFSCENFVIRCRAYGEGRILAVSELHHFLGLPQGEPGLRHWGVICKGWLALLLVAAATAQQTPASGGDFDSLLHQAFDFHQHSDYTRALPLLRRAWKLQPHDYFANLLLGIDLLRTGQAGEAVKFLQAAARTRPKEEFPHEYLGEAQASLKHYALAAESYSRGVQVAPQSSQAVVAVVDFGLARFADLSASLRSSRSGLAAEYRLQALAHPLNDPGRLQLLKRSADLDGNAPGIWSELALAEAFAGNMVQAEQTLSRALQHNSDDLRAWLVQAMLAAQRGNWQGAGRKLNEIAAHSPAVLANAASDWPVTLQPAAGEKLTGAAADFLSCVRTSCSAEKFNTGRPSPRAKLSAGTAFHEQRWEVLAHMPRPAETQPQVWLQRGTALVHLGDCEGAIPALERGIDQNPEPVYGMFLLSWCYARQAGTVAAHLQQSGEDDALVHMMRGDVLLRLQANSAGAISEYKDALAKSPDDPAVLQRLAEAELAAGQMEAARASAQSALKLDPHRLPAMQTLAKIAMDERDYTSALPYLRQLLSHDPNDLTTRVQLGTACAQTGALAEALQNLAPALAKGYPDEKGSLHSLLGTVLRKMGRTSEANQAFAQARELSDDFQRSSRQDPKQVGNEPH